MPESGGYLPPVVARVVGDISDLVKKIEQAKEMLRDLGAQKVSVAVTGDISDLTKKITAAKAMLADVAKEKTQADVTASTSEATAALAKLKVELADIQSKTVHVTVVQNTIGGSGNTVSMGIRDTIGGNGHPVTGTLAAGALGSLFGTGAKEGSGGLLSGLLWGENGGGFLSRLLSPLTALGTMFSAGFGSLGSFAGFGPEHLAMTGAGLAGSATEGALGGGLLALGSAGKDIVGGGADALTNKSFQSAISGYRNLAQIVAEYGKNSTEAQHAANLLNEQLQGESTAAKNAAKGIATAAHALGTQWRKASSNAQIESGKIMSQVLSLASSYTGRVASAAQANLSIINTGLKPLFAWMKGPGGVGVFNTLENTFKRDLPTAVDAFDQGLKLLLRTMALIAPKTGGFVKWLDQLFTRMNTTSGFAKWSKEVNKLIGDFHMWSALLKALGHDLRSLFKDDAGEPAAIVKGLTGELKKLGQWEDSVAGKDALKKVFTSHKGEIIALGKEIGKLIKSFGQLYMSISPKIVNVVTELLGDLGKVTNTLAKMPGGKYIAGLVLIGLHFKKVRGLAKKALSGIASSMMDGLVALAKYVAKQITGAAVITASDEAEAAAGAAASAAQVAAMGLIVLAIAGLVVAVYELVKHWKQIWGAIKTATKAAWNFLKSVFTDGINWVKSHWKLLAEILVAIFLPGAAPLMAIIHFWPQIEKFFSAGWSKIKSLTSSAAKAVGGFFANLGKDVAKDVSSLVSKVLGFFGNLGKDAAKDVSKLVTSVLGYFGRLGKDAAKDVAELASKVGGFFKSMWHGVTKTASNIWHGVTGFFKNTWHDATKAVSNLVHDAGTKLKELPGKVKGMATNAASSMKKLGVRMFNGLMSGIGNIGSAIWHKITGGLSSIGSDIGGFFGGIGHDIASVIPGFATGGMVSKPTLAMVGEAGPEMIIPVAALQQMGSKSGVSGLSVGSGPASSGNNVEALLVQILDVMKANGSLGQQTAANTKAMVAAAQGLSSPAGVAAQIRKGNSQLVGALRVGKSL